MGGHIEPPHQRPLRTLDLLQCAFEQGKIVCLNEKRTTCLLLLMNREADMPEVVRFFLLQLIACII